MMFREPRQKSESHLRFIRQLPCCICADNTTVEAAHVRFGCREAGKRGVGIGEKPADKWTVPLCGVHHRMQHTWGERDFWNATGKDPIKLAQELWANTGQHEIGVRIAREAAR